MLQISQTENPMCSATIDQIRLRRAMNLPLEFQNVTFSGFQSEIQVGSLELISRFPYFERRAGRHGCALAGHGIAFRERLFPGIAVGTDDLFSMDGFDGVARTAIQASCQARSARKKLREQWRRRKVRCFRHPSRATKIC